MKKRPSPSTEGGRVPIGIHQNYIIGKNRFPFRPLKANKATNTPKKNKKKVKAQINSKIFTNGIKNACLLSKINGM